jgi:hypothetical protein
MASRPQPIAIERTDWENPTACWNDNLFYNVYITFTIHPPVVRLRPLATVQAASASDWRNMEGW